MSTAPRLAVEGQDRGRLGRRRLGALVLLGGALVAQGAWSVTTYPEPYPTVQLPGFGAAPTEDGLFGTDVLDVAVVDETGARTPVRVGDLMAGVRPSSARPSLSQVFWPDAGNEATADDPRVLDWLESRAGDLVEGTPVGLVVTRCDAELDITTAGRVSGQGCEEKRMSW